MAILIDLILECQPGDVVDGVFFVVCQPLPKAGLFRTMTVVKDKARLRFRPAFLQFSFRRDFQLCLIGSYPSLMVVVG